MRWSRGNRNAKPSPTTRRRLLAGAIASLFFLLCVPGAVAVHGLVVEDRRLTSAQQRMDLLAEARALVANLEFRQREYLVTGLQADLARYHAARHAWLERYPELLAAVSQRHGEPVEPLDRLVQRRVELADANVTMRQGLAGRQEATDLSLYHRGGAVMALVSQEIDRLSEPPAALRPAWQRQRMALPLAMGVLGTAGIVLTGLFMWSAERQERRRQRHDQALRVHTQALQDAVQDHGQALRSAFDRIQAFASELDHGIEQERRRLAREVHDQFGQIATSMKMEVMHLAQTQPGLPASATRDLLAMLDDAIAMARRITAELRPPLLDDLGFEAAVDHYAHKTSEGGMLQVTSDIQDGQALSERQANQLFRILQEAVTNVLRHARATHVHLAGALDADHAYVFTVTDNGQGLQPARPDASGLRNMAERAALAGGTLVVRPGPSGGTVVMAALPVPRKANA